jgi:hypothetical protein
VDGRRVDDLDVVVLATGYQHGDYSWLPADVEQRLGADEDGLYLYRHVLPPRVPVRTCLTLPSASVFYAGCYLRTLPPHLGEVLHQGR